MPGPTDSNEGPPPTPWRERSHVAEWVGHRVVVRSVVPAERGPSGGPALVDVVGTVVSVDESEIVVRRRDGGVRTVSWTLVVVAKRIPDTPPRAGRRRS